MARYKVFKVDTLTIQRPVDSLLIKKFKAQFDLWVLGAHGSLGGGVYGIGERGRGLVGTTWVRSTRGTLGYNGCCEGVIHSVGSLRGNEVHLGDDLRLGDGSKPLQGNVGAGGSCRCALGCPCCCSVRGSCS